MVCGVVYGVVWACTGVEGVHVRVYRGEGGVQGGCTVCTKVYRAALPGGQGGQFFTFLE